MASFVVDAQLPPGLARRLRRIGHDAVHVFDLVPPTAADYEIRFIAQSRRAILISKDQDFVPMAVGGEAGCLLLWIRVGNTTNDVLWEYLEPLLPAALQAFADGETIVEVM